MDESIEMKERIESEIGRERCSSACSVKDRAVVGPADHVLNCTNRIPGVGGSRNR